MSSPPATIAEKGPPAWRTWLVWLTPLAFLLFIALNAGWEDFISYLMLGLPQGGIIAMIAMGYSMVYGIILLINFAHGEVFMFSAYLALALIVPLGWQGETSAWIGSMVWFAAFLGMTVGITTDTLLENKVPGRWPRLALGVLGGIVGGLAVHQLFRVSVPFVLALVLSALFCATIGISMDRLAYRPLRRAPRLIPLITAIGVSILLMNMAQAIFRTTDYRIPDESLPKILQPYYEPFTLGEEATAKPEPTFWSQIRDERTLHFTDNIRIPLTDVIIVVLALGMMLGVNAFVQKTKTGTAMRACSMDQTMARLVGIDVNRTVAITFAIGCMLAAVASPFYVIKYVPIQPQMGMLVGILAFSSAVLGGIGNIKGAMLGGFLIGVTYNMVPLLEYTAEWPFFKWLAGMAMFSSVENWNVFQGISEWRLGIAYLLMIFVIIFRPSGLLGRGSAAARA